MQISQDLVAKLNKKFIKNPVTKFAMNAVGRVELPELAINRELIKDIDFSFSHEVDVFSEATAQQKVGICWMFAALNLMRSMTIKKIKVKSFEFSGTHLMFWDKFEKANYFLEKIIEFRDRPRDDRTLKTFLDDPIPDGGDWYMFVNLVKKYGLVPASVMQHSQYSKESTKHNEIVALKLRQFASKIRAMHKEGKSLDHILEKREDFLGEIYKMLIICFGVPPTSFHWSYKDDDKNFHREAKITPQEFFEKYVGADLDDFCCLWSCPLESVPYGKTYSISHSRRMVGGDSFHALNLPLDVLKKLAIDMIKAGEACVFSCDVGKDSLRKEGLMYKNLYNYDLIFGTDFEMNRADRLEMGEAKLTHSMLLVGVDIHRGKPVKWKVENSWGTEVGRKGFFIMSDEWFDEHVYQILAPKRYLDKPTLKAYAKKPVILDPWHPMY